MEEPIIEVQSISTRFGKNVVHKDVSFTVSKGKVYAIIGGSGCGKSVLLREIVGLLRPEGGTIKLLGQDVWKSSDDELSALRNRIGVLFQNGALFSALTVGENIEVPLREQMDLPECYMERLTELRLILSGLEPKTASNMPSELSGGMRKRAALARALALEPEVLFLDEPTSGLDPINARAFDTLIRTLCDNLGLTVVLVTHDLDTLWGIVDQLIVLGSGTVLASGSVNEVAKNPDPWIREYFAARTDAAA